MLISSKLPNLPLFSTSEMSPSVNLIIFFCELLPHSKDGQRYSKMYELQQHLFLQYKNTEQPIFVNFNISGLKSQEEVSLML